MRNSSGFAISGVYVFLGVIGLTLAIAPGYGSPIFPAAGLALAAALHFGGGAVPFIGLGSLLLNLGVAVHGPGLTWSSGLAAVGIAVGATLQAVLGQWLVRRRLGGCWQGMESEGQVIAFLLQGGLLACLVSASVAVCMLWVFGVIGLDGVIRLWLIWYSGDLLGVAIFGPLALLFFAPDSEASHERRRRITPPIVIAFVLSLFVYAGAANVEKRRVMAQLEQDGEEIARRIHDRLLTQTTVLESLKHFVKAHPNFSYAQFEDFTESAITDNPDIFALSFNDLVPRGRLRAYEAEVTRNSPLGPFLVTERDAQQQLVPVSARPDYVAVRYIVPLQGNAPAVGFDINSEPIRREAITHARVSGKMAVTGPVRLVQENSSRMGVLVLDPIFHQARELLGFAVAVLKVDELIDIAVRDHVPPGLNFDVRDSSVPGDDLRFYRHEDSDADSVFRWQTPLQIADRKWVLDLWATDAYSPHGGQWLSWLVAVVALLFTSLLQIYLHGLVGRALAMRWQNEALLGKQSELQLAETVYENMADAIVVTDVAGHILAINPAFSRITGYRLADVAGKRIGLLGSGQHEEDFYERLWERLISERKWQGEVVNRRKNGELYTELLTITAVTDADGAVSQYVGTFSDITDKKLAQNRIEFMAYHDMLTELPNRTLGRQRAEEAIASARRYGEMVGILFIDLDNFKLVNDTYGHSIGDKFLQAVALRLRASARAEDCVCRLSGDEFMVIVGHGREIRDIAASCEHLLADLGQAYQLEGRLITTTLSAGIAVYPTDGENAEELLRKADTAMFEAKHDGRNTYRFFNPAMNQRIVAFVETRNALAEAIQNDEFELFYQPQVRLRDQVVSGVEALIRWRHPERGLIGPGVFIPVAEQSGLIVPIGAWAMRQACRQMKAWIDAGLPMKSVAVNLSAIQFKTGNIEQTVMDALALAGLDPEHLELELTESILIGDHDETLMRVAKLKELGIRLSIDDFGTGYSSMAYLKRFHADKLKIDSSFAAKVDQEAEDAAIVRSIIQMAEALGMETTAEGVERVEAVEVLRTLGCDQIQGYYYAKPMPAAEFSDWLAGFMAQSPGPRFLDTRRRAVG